MAQEVPSGASEWNDTGLTNGMVYRFRVTAKNSEGESVPSNEVQSYPLDRPSCPLGLKAVTSDGSITPSWAEPSSNGGSPVLGYDLHRTEDGTWTKVHRAPSYGLFHVDRSVDNGRT